MCRIVWVIPKWNTIRANLIWINQGMVQLGTLVEIFVKNEDERVP